MKKKQIEAMIKLSKKAEKECRISRPAIAGAYYDKDKNRTYICDGYWAVMIDGFVEGLKMRDEKGSYPCLENLMGKSYEYTPTTMDYSEVKQKAKTYRKPDIENTDTLVKIGDQYFNPQYVSSVIDCFEVYQVSTYCKFPMLLIESDGIKAIICGIRPRKKGEK